jgi:flagellar hook assembly protein FlgD
MDVYLLPGQHMLEWDGRNDRGEHVGTGLYVLRLRAGSFAATRKLIVPGG